MNSLNAALHLTSPLTVSQQQYDRVRADPRLQPVLEQTLLPVLESAGPPGERLSSFAKGRQAGLDAYVAAKARGEGVLTPSEATSKNTGPGPDPALSAFDGVCTDLLRRFFIEYGERVVKADAPRDERIALLTELEQFAKAAFPWDPAVAQTMAVRMLLLRSSLATKH